MSEIIFLVDDAPGGGFSARALGHSILAAADSESELQDVVRDAVACHFEEGESPKLIRLHYVREEADAAGTALR